MSLPRAPSEAGWLPSHVRVTVVQARGLRAKGGPGDAVVAALQLGRQKHRTSAAGERGGGGGPRWDEECALELPPASEPDAAALLLQLTVWQRALVGPDRFLGRAVVQLAPLLQDGLAHPDQWHKLHSKPGKKEKERGEIQVSIHFTRHSLTASMFDLSVKDKPRSPFGKLRDKMKGRRQYDLESASAIIPSSSGALEDDLGLGGKKAKGGGGFFFKNRLRKSSLTQSSTSLGSDSTVSSASSMAGVGATEAVAAPSPNRHGSLPADRSARDFFLPSPKLTHKRAFSDEASKIHILPESKSVQSLKPQSEPISRSSLCINGSHIYCEEPSPKPSSASPLPQRRPKQPVESSSAGPPPPLNSEPPLWSSSSLPRPPQKDPPRFIPSPPILAAQEEDKLSVKTLALSRHRNRAKMDDGTHAEGKPVQIAMPMVFSAEAGKGRPSEEAQKEEKRAKVGFFRQGSTREEDGKSRVAETAGHAEGEKSGRWFSTKEAQDPTPRLSSQSELLATTELAKDTLVCEDRGPSSFLRAGTLQPESAPPSPSAFEPAAAASHPPEWGDPFDAFATSRLRPEAQREPLPHQNTASGGLAEADPSKIAAGPSPQWPSKPAGSPGAAPEEARRGGGNWGEQPWGTGMDSRPRRGPGGPSGACEEDEISRAGLNGKEPTPAAAVEAEAANTWRAAWQASSAGVTGAISDSEPPHSQTSESGASQLGSSEEYPLSPPKGSKPERPAGLPLGTCLTPEAALGEASVLNRQERTVFPMPQAPGPEPAPGHTQPPEEANQLGCSAEEGKGWEQPGEGRPGSEVAPLKPPWRFALLGLEEEANEAARGAQARCESQEGPGADTHWQRPRVTEGRPPWAAAAVIGAGGGNVSCGTEGLGLPVADEGPTSANELASHTGPLGDSVLATNEGAGGAEQFETCPGKPGLSGEGEGEQPLPRSAASSEFRPRPVPRLLPAAKEGPLGPPGTQELEPSPSVLFWTALEEQLAPPWDGATPEQPKGLGEGTSNLGWSLEQGDGAALPLSNSQALPAASVCPQVLASGMLRQGPGGSSVSDSELSSSWSDDRVIDFKKADFWQEERGEENGRHDAVVSPGNPFVSRVSPQNNPFVERPPDHLPALQAPPGEGVSFRDLHAEAAPQVLLPANLSQDQPAAPFLHDHQPLAFSTPSLEAATSASEFDFPSPIVQPAAEGGSAATSLLAARLSLALPAPSTDVPASLVLPVEMRPADEVPARQTTSPHPVKPISTSRPVEKPRRSSLPLGQEKLKPKSTSGADSATPILPLEKTEQKRDPSLPDCSAKYYHLTHDELIQLVLKREAELSKKQEHIRELENYIDRLLVRIMEQSPTLLQIPLGGGAKAAK